METAEIRKSDESVSQHETYTINGIFHRKHMKLWPITTDQVSNLSAEEGNDEKGIDDLAASLQCVFLNK